MKPSSDQVSLPRTPKRFTLLKNILLFLGTIFSTLFFIELLAMVLIVAVRIDVGPTRLVESFPAQLRLSHAALEGEVKSIIRPAAQQTVGQFYYSFKYDPVLGYRIRTDLQERVRQEGDRALLILAFGGSTTVGDWNWPHDLQKAAQEAGVQETFEVMNFGVGGYTSFSEKLWFSHWVLPTLEDLDIKPDIVLSLDGSNDIYFGIFGYAESLINKSETWYWNYHAYHQQLDAQISQLQQFKGLVSATISGLMTTIRITKICQKSIRKLSHFLPYTLKLITAFRGKSYKKLPLIWDEKNQVNILPLPEEVQDRVINSFKNNNIDFYSMAESRGIKFISYLQPVMLAPYYEYPSYPDDVRFPNLNYAPISHRTSGSLMGGDYILESESIYKKAEAMYEDLNKRFPGHFKNLTGIFRKATSNQYARDSIHYTEAANETIAGHIVNDLIAKKILTTKQE